MAEIYKSQFSGQEIDERLELIPELQEGVEAAQQAADGKYTKPASGIPMTDLSDEVQEAIEEGGGQADWAQTDTTAPDYIKNKPDIPTAVVRFTPQTLAPIAQAQARANIGAGTYSKPATGIPASDLAAGVIPTVPTDVVKYSSQSLTDEQKTQARTNIGAAATAALTALETAIAAKYTKPSTGIPETDLAANVQSALALARTSIQSLADYYDKTEVDSLLAAVSSEQYVDVTTLPTASASTLGKIYLVGPTNGVYDRYYTSYDGTTYSWVGVGTTEINLANYATKAEVSQLSQEVSYGAKNPTEVALNDTISGVLINSTGKYGSSSGAANKLYCYAVTKGDTLHITASDSAAHNFRYAFVAAKTDIVSGFYFPNVKLMEAASIDETVVAPITGYLVVFRGSSFTNTKVETVTPVVPTIDKKADGANNSVNYIGKVLGFNPSIVPLTVGYWSNNQFINYKTGAQMTNTGVRSSNPIFCGGAKYLYLMMNVSTGTTGNNGLAFYTADGTYISGVQQYLGGAAAGITPMLIPVPQAAATFRVGVTSADVDKFFAFIVDDDFASRIQEIRGGEKKHLKICLLGNSYTADAWRYVPRMLLAYGITVEIDFYYRGSGSLWALDTQWEDDSATGQDEEGAEHTRFYATCDTRKTSGVWITEALKSAKDIVSSKQFDIISLQQRGNRCKDATTYVPYLQDVIDKINAAHPYPYALCWFMAYNGASENATEGANAASIATQEDVIMNYPFAMFMPVATATFGAQENATLGALGDSDYEKMYANDDIHMQEGLPCYIGACVVVESLLRRFRPELSVLNDQFRATAANIAGLGMPSTANGDSTGVTDDNCYLAQKAAIRAVKDPFTIVAP